MLCYVMLCRMSENLQIKMNFALAVNRLGTSHLDLMPSSNSIKQTAVYLEIHEVCSEYSMLIYCYLTAWFPSV